MKIDFLGRLLIFFCFVFLLDSCGDPQPKKSQAEIEDAVVLVTNEIRKEPNNGGLYAKRALIYRDRKLYDLALADANKALSVDSTSAYFHQVKGEVYFASASLRPARLSLEKALEYDNRNTEVLFKLSEVEFLLRRYDDAFVHINQGLRINDRAAQGYFLKGLIYKELGDTTLSKSSFRTATEVNPDYYEAYMELATLFAYQKDTIAYQYYENAIEIKPQSAEALYGKGLLEQRLEKYDEALRTYRRLLDADPDNFLAFYNSGYIFLTAFAEYDTARMYFDSVLVYQPNMSDALYNKALAIEYGGDLETAIESYRDVLQVDPDHDLAASALRRLDQ